MAQEYKYDTYKYASKASLLNGLSNAGYVLNDGGELQTHNVITDSDTGESLNMHYLGTIVTNLDTEGEPVYSTYVYVHCARISDIKLPSNKKLTGNERKYFNNYINKYFGEEDL